MHLSLLASLLVVSVTCIHLVRAGDCRGGRYPYYFGETWPLSCLKGKKGKRSAYDPEWRWVHKLTHRYIKYRGKYFEYGKGVRSPRDTPLGWENLYCKHETESSPAGYSNVSVNCITACTKKWQKKVRYNWFSQNCHHFANRMSKLLCTVREGYCWTSCLNA